MVEQHASNLQWILRKYGETANASDVCNLDELVKISPLDDDFFSWAASGGSRKRYAKSQNGQFLVVPALKQGGVKVSMDIDKMFGILPIPQENPHNKSLNDSLDESVTGSRAEAFHVLKDYVDRVLDSKDLELKNMAASINDCDDIDERCEEIVAPRMPALRAKKTVLDGPIKRNGLLDP